MRALASLLAFCFVAAMPTSVPAFTVYDSFGAFPAATWGGTGIPNDAVAASMQIVDGATTVTVAMNATQRFSNPLVTNNGAAVYFAGPGSNFGGAGESSIEGALWNFNYYLSVSGPGKLADYQIDIWYDFDPAGPNAFGDLSGLGRIDLTATLLCGALCGADPNATLVEDSQNLMFGFLGVDNLPFIDAPVGGFDPNATGNYQFAITVSRAGFPVDTVAMEVQVVPIPAALWLFGSALGLLGYWTRRSRPAGT